MYRKSKRLRVDLISNKHLDIREKYRRTDREKVVFELSERSSEDGKRERTKLNN